MKRTPVLMMLVAVMALATMGCDTTKAPPGVAKDPLPAGQYPQVVALGGLSEYLVADHPVVEISSADKPMNVAVPVRSLADVPLNVQYLFEFYDRTGRPLKSNQGWRFMNIAPRVQVFMEASALETEAASWRLQIRPAR